jgi:hypothetical protein
MPPSTRQPEPNLAELAVLQALLVGDLDEVRGGLRPLHGHLDQPRVIMCSDHLLQVAGELSSSVEAMGDNLRVFNEAWTAETYAYRGVIQAGGPLFPGRGDQEVRRERRITASVGGFFIACGSALDAVAATTIGVLGLAQDLVTAGWPNVGGDTDQRRKSIATAGNPAQQVQQSALALLDDAVAHGPDGWLPWTLGMRHMLIHRAKRFDMRRFYRLSKRDQLTFVLHLPKEPQLTDVEAMILDEDPTAVWLWEHAGDTMAGVRQQLVSLVGTISGELGRVWRVRQANPGVITQPVKQWREMFPRRRDRTGFTGFGTVVPPIADGESLHINPLMGSRLRAAKLVQSGSDENEFWPRALAATD